MDTTNNSKGNGMTDCPLTGAPATTSRDYDLEHEMAEDEAAAEELLAGLDGAE